GPARRLEDTHIMHHNAIPGKGTVPASTPDAPATREGMPDTPGCVNQRARVPGVPGAFSEQQRATSRPASAGRRVGEEEQNGSQEGEGLADPLDMPFERVKFEQAIARGPGNPAAAQQPRSDDG